MNAEEEQVEILSQDSFDRDLTPAEAAKAMKGTFSFDHPDGYNNKVMESVLTDIINVRQTKVHVYTSRQTQAFLASSPQSTNPT